MPSASRKQDRPMRRRFSDPSPPLSRRCSSLAAASLVVAALLSPPLLAAVRATSPRRAAPLFEMPIGFSTAAARVSSTLLPPLVDAAPHRVAPLVATTPLVTTTPLSPHSPPLHLSSPRCHISSTSFLSSPLHLSSPRCHAFSPPLPLLIGPRLRPRHSYRCICTRAFRRFAAVLCVFGERCVNVLLCA